LPRCAHARSSISMNKPGTSSNDLTTSSKRPMLDGTLLATVGHLGAAPTVTQLASRSRMGAALPTNNGYLTCRASFFGGVLRSAEAWIALGGTSSSAVRRSWRIESMPVVSCRAVGLSVPIPSTYEVVFLCSCSCSSRNDVRREDGGGAGGRRNFLGIGKPRRGNPL